MTKAKPNPLTRKVGPLPVYAYLVVAVAAFLVLRGRSTAAKASTLNATPVPVSTSASGDDSGAAGGGGSGGGPDTSMPLDLLSKLFSSQTGTIDTLTQALVQQQTAQPAATQTAPGQDATIPTAAQASGVTVVGATPEGYPLYQSPNPANPPTVDPGFDLVSSAATTSGGATPWLDMATPATQPHVSTPTVAKPAAVHYYTYKSEVPLQGGQTLHFTSGKGYYAA